MNSKHSIGRRCLLFGATIRCLRIGVVWAVANCGMDVRAEDAAYSEYDVKAACLASFTQYVKWPANAFPDPGAPFTIGILGDDPFGGVLDKLVQGQTVAGHRIVIRRGRKAEDLRNCQLVFISKSESARIAECLGALQGGTALTVGETTQFTGQGGMIGITMDGKKVRLTINSGTARRAGLELSSKLLKLDRSSP